MRAGRRRFLGAAAAGALGAGKIAGATSAGTQAEVSLCGAWQFRATPEPDGPWMTVDVPHTWQIMPGLEDHRGEAYNNFDDYMLPRGRSSDWAHDGGIVRPVRLLVTPRCYIEHVKIDADPDLTRHRAAVSIAAEISNSAGTEFSGTLRCRIVDAETGLAVAEAAQAARVPARETATVAPVPITLRDPKLWHFDHPHLYTAEVTLEGHTVCETFGIRRFEVRDGAFHLNGERVTLMGVERMAGSHPDYGMAEPESWIRHDHDDLKELNCVFTRVHWPQDRRVLDYCDRHGIVIQTEVPAWGGKTFDGMTGEPSANILNNGLQQLREMIGNDRNHPSIVAWGLCNETNGQNPPAAEFARRLLKEAKRLDPHRLCSYASNSLQTNPARDVAGEMDFIEWNEYYGSWYKGTAEDLRRNLDEIARAFPGKPIVISEYGYCACTPERPEGDEERIRILREQSRVMRSNPALGGLIFFCYNDYRTHIGDQGVGALQQRVHGVVDLFGRRKPSFEALREESSPVTVEVAGWQAETPAPHVPTGSDVGQAFPPANSPQTTLRVLIRARERAPGYALRGYRIRGIVYGTGEIPVERREAPLPDLEPGRETQATLSFQAKTIARVRVDVVRPTGFSAFTAEWRPK